MSRYSRRGDDPERDPRFDIFDFAIVAILIGGYGAALTTLLMWIWSFL